MGRSGSIPSEPLAGGGGAAKPRVSLLRPHDLPGLDHL